MIIHIPYLLRRMRRSRVYGGIVFVLVLCARRFRVASLVSPPPLGLFRGGFVFSKLNIFWEFCGNIAYLESCLPRLGSVPGLLCGESGLVYLDLGGKNGFPRSLSGAPKGGASLLVRLGRIGRLD